MRKRELYWIFAVCMLMLSSCLGETNTQITVGLQEAVYQINPARGFILKDGRLIYSSQINSVNADHGDCFLVEYSFDTSNPELQASDSLEVELLGQPVPIPLWPLDQATLVDTILTNEQYISTIRTRTPYIKGRLFLWTEMKEPESQVDSLVMSYDPDELYTEAEGIRQYNLYLRAVRKSVEENDTIPVTMVHTDAFVIEDFFNKALEIEKTHNSEELNIAVNYASGHNKDTTAVNWSRSSLIKFKLNTTSGKWELD